MSPVGFAVTRFLRLRLCTRQSEISHLDGSGIDEISIANAVILREGKGMLALGQLINEDVHQNGGRDSASGGERVELGESGSASARSPSLAIWLRKVAYYFRPADSGPLPILENTNPNITVLNAGIESLVIVRKVHCHHAVDNLVNEQMHHERRPLRSAFCRVVSDRAPALCHLQRKLIKDATGIRTHDLRLAAFTPLVAAPRPTRSGVR
jgi:hypothetical protein